MEPSHSHIRLLHWLPGKKIFKTSIMDQLQLAALPPVPRPAIDLILNRTEAGGAETPFLFLGNADAAKDLALLRSHAITHIVTAAFNPDDPNETVGAVYPSDFTYHEVQILDSSDTDIRPHLGPCADFIRDAKQVPAGRVLVHCKMGTSRSSSLLLFYMMRDECYSLRNALLHVMHVRSLNPDAPYTHPNRGFMATLIEQEKAMAHDGCCSLTLSNYMSKEFSSGKNISHGPVGKPKPRRRADVGSLEANQ
jgi:protein-tyrosine phosphatase